MRPTHDDFQVHMLVEQAAALCTTLNYLQHMALCDIRDLLAHDLSSRLADTRHHIPRASYETRTARALEDAHNDMVPLIARFVRLTRVAGKASSRHARRVRLHYTLRHGVVVG